MHFEKVCKVKTGNKTKRQLTEKIAKSKAFEIGHKPEEEGTRISEEKYRLLVDNANEAILVIQYGLIKFCNAKFNELVGYPKNGLPPKLFLELVHPDDQEILAKNHLRRLKGEEVLNIYSFRIIDKYGIIKWLEINATLITWEGKPAILAFLTDITERKRAEEKLRESERKYKTLVENLPEKIFVKDKNSIFVSCNENYARDLGIDPEEIVGRTAFDFYPKELAEKYRADDKTIMESGATEHIEEKYIQGGQEFVVETVKTPLKDEEGSTFGLLGIFWDITARKQMEQELIKSHEQLRNLANHLQSIREEERSLIAREVHDDLGQVLTALNMDLSWLTNKLPKDQKILSKKTKSMSKLIHKTIQKLKRIATELRPRLLDDLGLVAAIEWEKEEFQKRSGIECDITIYPGEINLDKGRSTAIFRIFQEMLTNIARHSNATKVKVNLTERQGQIVLRVKDNGVGIPEDQISNSKSLGLIGIRERAYSFGGNTTITGIPGKGTAVIVSIPLDKKE